MEKSDLDTRWSQASPDWALRITAVRETFEESGVLVHPTQPDDQLPHNEHQYDQLRQHVHENPSLFCEFFGNLFNPSHLVPWHHFHPPSFVSAPFDTMFYLAVPSFLKPDHFERYAKTDANQETHDLKWFTPAQALAACDAGEIQLAPPQWIMLNELRHNYPTLTSLAHAAKTRACPIPYRPLVIEKINQDQVLVLALPGDEHHDQYTGQPGDRHRLFWNQAFTWQNIQDDQPAFELEMNLKQSPAEYFRKFEIRS